MAAEARGDQSQKRNGKELASELPCRSRRLPMRFVLRPAGRSLRRAFPSRTARPSRTAKPTTSGRAVSVDGLGFAFTPRAAAAIQRSDVERGQDPQGESAFRRRSARRLLAPTNSGDRVYLDMCDADWRAIEIDADGLRLINDVPVHFRREARMLPLPAPSMIDPKKG